jgi:hypothetical protein
MSGPNASQTPPSLNRLGAQLLAAALTLPAVGLAQAESAPEKGLVSFKFLDYLDSQPGADRIRVRAPSLLVTTPLSGAWSLSGSLISDSISGASPAYHTSGLTHMADERHAAQAEATRYFANGTITLGGNHSSESDYVSSGLSLQGTRSSEDKNTTWSAGVGFNTDRINPTNGVVENEHKRTLDLLVGVTQVLGTHDIAQLDLGHSWGSGYFSDPYKVFDNRPRQRDHTTLLARWNHHFEATTGTLRSSWRYYDDSYGIRAHTFGFEYVQPLAGGWTVTPLLRVYTQSAARFYVNADPSTEPFPPNPPDGAAYYAEDQRLSAFGARTIGIKLAKQIGTSWMVDLKVERYQQRAAWRLFGSGSPDLQPFNARSIQVGLSHTF